MMPQLSSPPSLQTRLLVLVLVLATMVWVGVAAVTWIDARHELDELLDGHLAQAAALLAVQPSHGDDDDGDELADAPSLHKYAPRVAFQVFHEGQLVKHSANAGLMPMSSLTRGFATVTLGDGHEWRVFAAPGHEHDEQVYVAEQTASRRAILLAVLRSVLLPLMLALPLLGLACAWAVRRGLLPLRHLRDALAQRKAGALESVTSEELPAEMQPVIDALNGLFLRIERMVATERRFTADAAHELRTPIAAIRAQAQVALGAGTDVGQREHALRATLEGCDRATRLVAQLLMLARLEEAPAVQSVPFELGGVVRSVAAELAPHALARQQILELETDALCDVTGNALLFGVLVRNLIDNALRYSPDGARVQVAVLREVGHVLVRVQDSGPGMSESDIDRLGERFYRLPGNERPGSGLGWSIVKRIAEVLPVQITVNRSRPLGGLAVTVQWPMVAEED
jgi:two-component system, OmpR family, sensor histidine kinase QseC